MKRITKTYATANSGDAVQMNWNNTAVAIGFVAKVSGTVNYTVNHTYDDLNDSAITPVWLPYGESYLVGATATQEGNFVIPISGIQIVINSGTGSVTLVVLQQGII